MSDDRNVEVYVVWHTPDDDGGRQRAHQWAALAEKVSGLTSEEFLVHTFFTVRTSVEVTEEAAAVLAALERLRG